MEGLRPTVAASINGHDTRFVIDTGFFFSAVSNEALEHFGMRRSMAPFGLEIRGVGGTSKAAQAGTADNFAFADVGFKNIQFLVGGRVGGDETAGVIGQNIMGPFDVEYDFGNGVMRYYKAQGCEKCILAYWSKGMALSQVSIDAPGRFIQRVLVRAEVNGRPIHAVLDTGSPVSYLSTHAAARAGVAVGSEGVTNAGITYGIYGKGIETFLVPFASFKIGDEEIKNTQLRVADIELGDGVDMLLGADFFLSHHILISNTQKKLYFTYNGGPVFRLDRRSTGQQAQAEPPPPGVASAAPASAGQAAGGASASQQPAAEIARRAAAEAARRDFPAAIADYGKAIELEPTNADHYHARALARLSNRQPVLAMADLDQALKYKPDDLRALVIRGELYLQSRDLNRAQADFDAALKLAPGNSSLAAQIGVAYAQAGQAEPALKQLDSWIAAHPRDESLAQALGARCWARTLSGKQLDLALADCDQALRKDRNSVIMTYRATTLYRMDRLDDALAQYAAALKLQPGLAPALYGRGLAELKKGAKSEGEADLAAARNIAPGLPQQFRRFGLAPDVATPAPAKAGG